MSLYKLSNLTKIDQYRENYKLEFLYNFYKYFFLHIVHLRKFFLFIFFIIKLLFNFHQLYALKN